MTILGFWLLLQHSLNTIEQHYYGANSANVAK